MNAETGANMQLLFPLLLAAIFILGSPPEAYAYLDPNSFNLVIQLVVGGLVSCLLCLKLYWQRASVFVSGLLSKGKGKKDD